jgi:hypothetical protein
MHRADPYHATFASVPIADRSRATCSTGIWCCEPDEECPACNPAEYVGRHQ